jgi:hypothetical protein
LAFILMETKGSYARVELGRFPTATAAMATIRDIVLAEEDYDYPGYYDVIDRFGRIYVIHPIKDEEAID